MKRLITLLLLCFAISIMASAQKVSTKVTYKMVNGKVTQVTAQKKAPDPVYAIVSGTVFYKGAKGGIYYWQTSAKTGLMYKKYVK